jgi:hypothetical protein
MDETTDITTRTQRFNDAARTFTLPSPARHAKFAPFKDGIVELRQKGASLRLIRELWLQSTWRSGRTLLRASSPK